MQPLEAIVVKYLSVVAVFSSLVAVGAVASAQEPFVAPKFQIFAGTLAGLAVDDPSVTILLNTQTGETWAIFANTEKGVQWAPLAFGTGVPSQLYAAPLAPRP